MAGDITIIVRRLSIYRLKVFQKQEIITNNYLINIASHRTKSNKTKLILKSKINISKKRLNKLTNYLLE